MGIVTNYLITLIKKQVDTHRLILWFDPEKQYEQVITQLALLETRIVRYEESYFALRYEVEPLLNGVEPPRLLVYLPLHKNEMHDALIELERLGEEIRPGHPSLSANTRLSLIARYALKPLLGEETANTIEKQVIAGQFSLAELDILAEKGEGITKGVTSLIFGTNNAQEMALSFLTSEKHDASIEDKGAMAELELLLHDAFGIEVIEDEVPEAYRVRLARYLLITDLITTLQGEIPTRLDSVQVATGATTREACRTLARVWRVRSDLTKSYAAHANRVEYELGIASIDFTLAQIANVETFLTIEKQQQACFSDKLREKATDELVEKALLHQSCFWSEYLPEVQASWALIVMAGHVLLEAERIEQSLRSPMLDAKALFTSYTEDDRPWCMLDTYHRHMERRYYEFSFHLDESLDQLLVRAKNRYMDVGATLAERFLQRFQAEKFQIADVLRQKDIFEKRVKPHLAEGKVAYVWVDALRYEMARELAQTLSIDANPELETALGTVPTITEIGMAALLPGARNAKIVSAAEGKLALEIDGVLVKDRKDRISFLKAHCGAKLFEARLDDLLPKTNKKIKDGIREADLILITSQEIDMLGEENNVVLARRTMDEALRQLQHAFRILGQEKVKTIICTADHGYLFAEELSSSMKVNPPGGHTADLHRRVWVGQGGQADSAYMRTHLADCGLSSEFDIAVPWNFSCFKVKGGADAYFHGGMSPQELILPVITLTPKKNSSGVKNEITWTLLPGSQKITTRLYSVQIIGNANSLFELVPPKVRLEIRDGQKPLSSPASASYGFEEATGDVQLKMSEYEAQTLESNTIALYINEALPYATVSVHLLDAISGVELERIEKVVMAISL